VQVGLAYGRGRLDVELPPTTQVVEPAPGPPLPDPARALAAALRDPVGCPPLAELARPGQRVALAVCDATRPQPRRLVVPQVLAELEGKVADEDVTILVATGTHRPNTEAELEEMLGPEVLGRYRVVNHDCRDPAGLADLGWAAPGLPARLNRLWVEADLRIATGLVEPHFFAGFSGGPKTVAPGLAGLDTILELHSARRIASPHATWGVVGPNPVQQGLRQVAALAPAHLCVDVVLGAGQRPSSVFAGEAAACHARACAQARRAAMAPVREPFDVVVTTNAGWPLDQNLYQAVKGMSAASAVVRPGGLVLCAAECADGLPEHGSFAQILASAPDPASLARMIESPGYSAPDQWQAQVLARVLGHCRVGVKASFLTDEELRGAHLEPVHDIAGRVSEELGRLGPRARVCALPEGPRTVPYLAA
jgi:nickel-dependent lactate racemase